MSSMLDQFKRTEENKEDGETGSLRAVSSDLLDEGSTYESSWSKVSNLLLELDTKRKEDGDTKDCNIDASSSSLNSSPELRQPSPIMSLPSSRDPCTDSRAKKDKKFVPAAVKQVFANIKEAKKREHEKKEKKKRFIIYKDEMALVEESMKRERPKFSMEEEATIASRVIKYFRVRLLQEAKEQQGPYLEPYPFKKNINQEEENESEIVTKSTQQAPLTVIPLSTQSTNC